MRELVLRPEARTDLVAIWRYTTERWGPHQARRYILALHEDLHVLAENPDLGRSYEHVRSGYRVYPSGKHLIFYRLAPEEVDVVRILHERMDVPDHP